MLPWRHRGWAWAALLLASTGLGLAAVERYVRASKGGISVDSQVGVGTTFRLRYRSTTSAGVHGAAFSLTHTTSQLLCTWLVNDVAL